MHAKYSCKILIAEIKVAQSTIKLELVYRNSHTLANYNASSTKSWKKKTRPTTRQLTLANSTSCILTV